MDEQLIKVTSVGVPYLYVPEYEADSGKPAKFACTQVNYSMHVNEIPRLLVYLSEGAQLKGETWQDKEELLLWIQQKTAKAKNGLVECEAYEEATGYAGFVTDRLIFKGYIVSGTYQYAGGLPSTRTICIDCGGLASVLLAAPFMAYMESTLGNIINRISGKAEMSMTEAINQGESYGATKKTITQAIAKNTLRKNITDKFAICLTAAKSVATYDTYKNCSYTPDESFKSAIGGSYKLDVGELGDMTEVGYATAFFEALVSRMHHADIWTSLRGLLTSDDYALQIVPRWTCETKNDFKMELMPITAWKPRHTLKLYASDIASFSMSSNLAAALNTPDVVIVDFNDSLSYLTGRNISKYALGIMGVTCADPKLQEKLRDLRNARDLTQMLEHTKKHKLRILSAPKWLTLSALNKEARDKTTKRPDIRDNIKNIKPPQTPADEQTKNEDASYEILKLITSANERLNICAVADVLATVLFLYYYKALDRATLKLPVDWRFGKDPATRHGRTGNFFENHLGDTIELDLSDTGFGSKLVVKAVLDGIQWSYASSRSTHAEYMLQLSRVRLMDPDEPSVECPIYKLELPGSTDSNADNAAQASSADNSDPSPVNFMPMGT